MVVELFLSQQQGIAFHKLNIVCSRSRVQDPIFVRKEDVLANQPNRTEKRDKRQCILRLQCRNPSLQRRLFHVYLVFVEDPWVPKLCGRYVRLQLVVLFENQGLLAKIHLLKSRKRKILGFRRWQTTKYFGSTSKYIIVFCS
jgi:hypothetical protein